MPLSIDNAQFDQFVRFAQQQMQAGNAKNICQESRLQFHGLFTGDLAYSVCRKDWFQ